MDVASIKSKTSIKVGFFMETTFHFYVYENIIFHLQQQSIACCLVINNMMDEPKLINDMLEFFRNTKLENLSIELLTSLRESKSKLSVMVSPYFSVGLQSTADYHVRAMYGLAKEGWNHAWWNIFYDIILCYGDYTKERLNVADNCLVVGNPKFDKWYFPERFKNIEGMLKIDNKKPVLLYAPTYGKLSSLDEWGKKLSHLQNFYNVIIKLHHGTTFRDTEKAQYKLAKSFFKNIITQSDITFELLKFCDYVLTDNSGFIFDSIYAGKRTILLTSAKINNIISLEEDYSNQQSAEFKMRDYLPVVENIESLRHCLAEEYDWSRNDKTIAEIRHHYCDPWQDGQAGYRAANSIINLIHNKKKIRNDIATNLRTVIFEKR